MTKQKKTTSPQEYMPTAEEVQAELAKILNQLAIRFEGRFAL
mgnify:CR=1 FL=1